MKRIANIFLAIMLSLMLVYLGGGATILTCCHDSEMKIGNGDKCCSKSCACCPMTNCMETTVVKLSPSVSAAKAMAKVPQATATDILLVSLFNYLQPQHEPEHDIVADVAQFHSPPRHYLTLMRVLRL